MKYKIASILGALTLVLGLPTLGTPTQAATTGHHVAAEKRDPCFFTDDEWDTWRHENSGAPGWGDTIGHLESLSNCNQDLWLTDSEGSPIVFDWKGKPERVRLWKMKDGTNVAMWMARNDDGSWHAHDKSEEHWSIYYQPDNHRECEWPRPSGDPCTET
jgi:hypothetical protein